jgi:hypothetical protein
LVESVVDVWGVVRAHYLRRELELLE